MIKVYRKIRLSYLMVCTLFSAQSMGASNYLVTFTNVPAGDFAVQLEGEESPACITPAGTRNVQRQMPTRFRTSSVSFTVRKKKPNSIF